MKEFSCTKCNSTDVFIKNNGTQKGLYYSDCGKWIKWLNKEEYRLVERQIENNKMEPEEPEKKIDLSQFSNEELLEEIRRRIN